MTVTPVSDDTVPTSQFKLALDPHLRLRLRERVRRENARVWPARMTQTALIEKALTEYLDRLDSEDRRERRPA